MEQQASQEEKKEQTNAHEIHTTALETTSKNVLMTSENSHMERIEETSIKLGVLADNGQQDTSEADRSSMPITEDYSTDGQDSHKPKTSFEEGPTQDIIENSHESVDETPKVSEIKDDISETDSSFIAKNTILNSEQETSEVENSVQLCENESNIMVMQELQAPCSEKSDTGDVIGETQIVETSTGENASEIITETVQEIDSIITEAASESPTPATADKSTPEDHSLGFGGATTDALANNLIIGESVNTEMQSHTSGSVSAHEFVPEEVPIDKPTDQTHNNLQSCPTATETVHQIHGNPQTAEDIKKIDECPASNKEQTETVAENDQIEKDETQVGSAEIQEGNLKCQLQEIIKEIDREVNYGDVEEEEPRDPTTKPHTWKPRKKYEIQKTEVKYENVVPICLPDVSFTERKKQEAIEAAKTVKKNSPPPPPKSKVHHQIQNNEVNGFSHMPLEIPTELPLLAKIAPKEGIEDGGREKIPLERLFTPATDSGEITARKRKVYASSSFYRPDHPTIEDQVELAHKISVSLIDDENKTSKGQSMYMKRKNRSSKWIHAADEEDELAGDYVDDNDLMPPKESKQRPPLKLLMNPKGIHDYTSIQHTYEEMSTSSQTSHHLNNIEGCREIISDMQSPTGKGAALFAKRKKRMDKFIVDENSVQKQNVTPKPISHETPPFPTYSQDFNVIANSISMLPPAIESASAGSLILPDLSQILTQPKPLEKKSTKERTTPNPKSGVKKEYSWNIPSSQMEGKTTTTKKVQNTSFHNAVSATSVGKIHESDLNLRPGTPPLFVIPDGNGNFLDKTSNCNSNSEFCQLNDQSSHNSESGTIYTAEVKVVQSPSLPATPIIIEGPTREDILFDQLSSSSLEDKRKSFNLAPKGWGTYADYYTPVHLGEAS